MTSEEFSKSIATIVRDMIKLKAAMIKRNLSIAKAKCPECEGMLIGQISSHRNKHFRMYCTGSCKRQMME